MARAKPPYKSHPPPTTHIFSDELKAKLRSYCPEKYAVTVDQEEHEQSTKSLKYFERFSNGADVFVEEILNEARWVPEARKSIKFRLTKEELKIEHAGLRRILNEVLSAENKIRNISAPLDNLLGADADPTECANALAGISTAVRNLLNAVENADPVNKSPEELPSSKTPAMRNKFIAKEFVLRILRVLYRYEIEPRATGASDLGYASPAVQILTLVGESVGLHFGLTAWRRLITNFKNSDIPVSTPIKPDS